MTANLKIGVPQSGYPIIRNILGSLPTWLKRVRPIDRHRITTALRYRCGLQTGQYESFTFARPYLIDCDLFHFFNTTADVRRPWITTFETSVPRWGDVPVAVRVQGLRLLESPWCRKVLALSEAAKLMANSDWQAMLPAQASRQLSEKTEVLLPPQAVLQQPEAKAKRDGILFAFIGNLFYRKGGLEMLEAFQRLDESGVRNWRALVVGNIDRIGDDVARADESDRQRARELLAALASRIEYHSYLPYPQVLETLKVADYYLLPTLADTFGYGVLEAQAYGAVAITTNVRALPEIVSEESGHVIHLPLDAFGNAHTLPGFEKTRSDLTDSLEVILRKCCESSREQRLKKAAAATANLRSRHDPEEHRRRLETIYRHALEASPEGSSG